jgi:hypothetical protein
MSSFWMMILAVVLGTILSRFISATFDLTFKLPSGDIL